MTRWRVDDLLDLEFFIAEDAQISTDEMEERDRRLYLDTIRQHLPLQAFDEKPLGRMILKYWLEERRREFSEHLGDQAVLPSESFREARGLAMILFGVLGIVSGSTLALSLLVYRGIEPVNVSVYFGVLVLLQLILFVLTLTRAVLMKGSGLFVKRYSAISRLVRGLTGRMFRAFTNNLSRILGAQRRSGIDAVVGIVKGSRDSFNTIFSWSVVSIVQVFGICFNIGVLLTTLVRVLTADLAFGWQTTLDVSAGSVYKLIHALSLPWAWCVPPQYAHPSLEQIEGSRMVLKEGIYSLASADLVSWWPFLVLSILFYGLLPRVIFFAWSSCVQRIALTRLDFTQGPYGVVIMRMMVPALKSSGQPSEGRIESGRGQSFFRGRPEEVSLENPTRALVLVPDELSEHLDREELEHSLTTILNWKVSGVMVIKGEFEADYDVIKDVLPHKTSPVRGLVLLMEGWQPPISETLKYLRSLRSLAGAQARIAVLLVGRPAAGTFLTPVDQSDREIWKRALDALGDRNLSLAVVGVVP
ncbi:MAG TPA: DUF2868 domain-containing protein [Deltaproteobacteria bacterium]|nr:DUF2868 domain-containing protein [Deltaproteobacteria bacterium]